MTPFDGVKPPRNDRVNFPIQMDGFIGWLLETFFPELQAVVAAFNFNATNSTSTTSVTIGVGSNKSLTVQTSKSYVPGMTIKVANTASPTNWMVGDVISYDSGTGALVFYPSTQNGSGTYAAWTISLAATPQAVGKHVVTAHSGNGTGAVDTKFRRFSTVKENIGTAITYADSSNNGASFAINELGDYSMTYGDCNKTAATGMYGITVNSSEGTTDINSVASSTRIMPPQVSFAASRPVFVTVIARLSPGDVVRAHIDGNCDGDAEHTSYFSIRKINNG